MSGANDPSSLVGTKQAFLAWVDASGTSKTLVFDVVVSEEWEEGTTVTEHPVETGANVADHVRETLPKCMLKVRSTNEPMDANQYDQANTAQIFGLSIPAPTWVPGSGVIVVPEYVNPIELRAIAGTAAGMAAGLAGQTANAIGALAGAVAAALLIPAYTVKLPTATGAGLQPDVPGAPPMPVVQYWKGVDYVEQVHALLVQLKRAAQLIEVTGSKQVEFNMVIDTLSFSRSSETGSGEDISIGLKQIRFVSTETVVAPIPNLPAGGGSPPSSHGNQDPVEAPVTVQTLMVETLGAMQSLHGAHP